MEEKRVNVRKHFDLLGMEVKDRVTGFADSVVDTTETFTFFFSRTNRRRGRSESDLVACQRVEGMEASIPCW